MSTLARPRVQCELHHATLSVPDVGAAAEYYATKLGFTLAFTEGDPPTFAGVNLDHVSTATELFGEFATPNQKLLSLGG
jgi:catechol 2,3-dioxygenase-like lactoylglutathione lyase family enzyme